jgi:hypothetical protein
MWGNECCSAPKVPSRERSAGYTWEQGRRRTEWTKLHTENEVLGNGSIFSLRSVARTAEQWLHIISTGGFAVHYGVIGDTRCARHGGGFVFVCLLMRVFWRQGFRGVFSDCNF